ncbi:MAG: Asp-tRNA(Asn)/Glu-tRNA(Gln) amidotransferase subunit GatC [Candidatus Promineofilum sp.]|nr:Asp-tRNA(Asn)/Glu-tRNA(Gln) amidotransferase subunit GatC [Promineifilum sp.]MBP9657808.1 Asp-tRNA(Asn)/Glu-tRNA(Gln) amidotransferase subunit GatC [Promineifilum sp.]
MSLTRADVEKIAHLSRLALTEGELTRFGEQLAAVLEHAAMLDELDLNDHEAQPQALSHRNVMRDDIVLPSLSPEDALFNAAETRDGQFFIQSVLDE